MYHPHNLSALPQTAGVSKKGAYTNTQHPSFCDCCPEDTVFDSLVLMASRGWVHKFNRMIANKETLLNWLSYQSLVQKEQTDAHLRVCHERGTSAYFESFHLRVQLPIKHNLSPD